MKYRPDLVIILDILEALNEDGVPISHICTYSNMPNPRVRRRLDQMIKNGLVEEIYDKDGKRLYKITEKGIKTRSKIREMIIFLNQLGLIDLNDRRY